MTSFFVLLARGARAWDRVGALPVALCALVALGCGDDAELSGLADAGESSAASDGGAVSQAPDAAVPAGPCVADLSAPVPSDRCTTDPANASLPACRQWLKMELPGTQCSDGSQYKFFVNYSEKSNHLVIVFEGGGACWDYASCTGGARGAANRNGIPDNHMDQTQYLNLLRREASNPLQDWNMVFVSYCTGDVHTGSKVATYPDPNGGAPLTYRHVGHDNTLKIIEWAKGRFPTIPKLLITGYSAGGIGGLENYYSIREGLPGAQCGYLLNDSGPAFHSDGPSKQVQEQTRAAWGADAILDALDGKLPVPLADLKRDIGLINTVLADKYPRDRLSLAVYQMDLNYSLYSYERFFPGSDETKIHELWSGELSKLLQSYDSRPNLAYYVPYFRADNCSHCVSIPPIDHDIAIVLSQPWLGSEIERDQVNLRDFVELLLDDARPLRSYKEDPQPSEQFTPEQSMKCMIPN